MKKIFLISCLFFLYLTTLSQNKFTNKKLIRFLEKEDCKVFPIDLDKKELTSEQILKLTENEDGIDLTYSSEFEESRKVYYDWLSYEVLNQNPNWVFIPFGTGDLYKNIIIRNSKEMDKKVFSKRFFGDKKILTQCNFMGAASNRKNIMRNRKAVFGLECQVTANKTGTSESENDR